MVRNNEESCRSFNCDDCSCGRGDRPAPNPAAAKLYSRRGSRQPRIPGGRPGFQPPSPSATRPFSVRGMILNTHSCNWMPAANRGPAKPIFPENPEELPSDLLPAAKGISGSLMSLPIRSTCFLAWAVTSTGWAPSSSSNSGRNRGRQPVLRKTSTGETRHSRRSHFPPVSPWFFD